MTWPAAIWAEAVEDAYRYDKLVVASVTYDAGVFPAMEDFLYHLQLKNYQNRTVGIMQNGSWGPVAGKKMKERIETFKNIKIVEPMVTHPLHPERRQSESHGNAGRRSGGEVIKSCTLFAAVSGFENVKAPSQREGGFYVLLRFIC